MQSEKLELKTFLLSQKNICQNNLKWFKNHYNELYLDFLTWNFPISFSFVQKLYHYLNEDKEFKLGLCSCGKRCRFISFKQGYHKFCSCSCSAKSSERIQHQKDTMEKLYGGCGNASSILKEKQKSTMIERYGDENFNKLKSYKVI